MHRNQLDVWHCTKNNLTPCLSFVTLQKHFSVAVPVYQEVDVAKHRGRSPNALHSATELPRVLLEMTSLAYSWPLLGNAPRGDRHPVLTLPGFTAGDDSTALLRRFLKRLGYRPLPWTLGQNTGSFEIQERLLHYFQRLTEEYDEPISLVGQSLGGVYARELARQFPAAVRCIVTLGSPFSSNGPESANPLVGRLFEYMSGLSLDDMRIRNRVLASEPPPVPSTAVYSKADGVVHWSACLEYRGERSENVEVHGSHTGMALNPLVFHVLADRLAQQPQQWRPFDRQRGCRAMWFPEPESTIDQADVNGGASACAS